MSEFTTVAKVADIPVGSASAFAVNGRMVAVFHDADGFHAIDDFCPHMGASLAGGHVEEGTVMCPWHAWRFSIRDGTWCDNPRIKIDSFPVRVEDGEIQVQVPERPASGSAPAETESCAGECQTDPNSPESATPPDEAADETT